MAQLLSWWIPCPYSQDFEKNRFGISEENSSILCWSCCKFFQFCLKSSQDTVYCLPSKATNKLATFYSTTRLQHSGSSSQFSKGRLKLLSFDGLALVQLSQSQGTSLACKQPNAARRSTKVHFVIYGHHYWLCYFIFSCFLK